MARAERVIYLLRERELRRLGIRSGNRRDGVLSAWVCVRVCVYEAREISARLIGVRKRGVLAEVGFVLDGFRWCSLLWFF